MFFVSFLCHTLTNTFRTQQRYRGPGSISSSYCGSFCLSDYLKHKIKCWSKWQPSHRSVLQSSLAPLVFLYFGLHFRLVTYLCRNRFPDTMLYMATVAKTAVTSKFDLCCRLLSAQRACMANTRDAPTKSHVRSLYGAVYAVFVLLSMTTGILYQVRTLYPISSVI